MTESDTSELNDEMVREALRDVAESVASEANEFSLPDLQAFRAKKSQQDRSRLIVGSSVAVLVALFLLLGVVIIGPRGPSHVATSPPPLVLAQRPVLAVSPEINLDITWNRQQVSVNLASGATRLASPIVTSAAAKAQLSIGLARAGYVIGDSTTSNETISVSDNLQRLIHVWSGVDGLHPAPATNTADVWLSQPFADPSRAQEFNADEKPVGTSVPIPHDSVVVAQKGSDLVVVSPANPYQDLELWDPSTARVVMNYGTYDQVATTRDALVWTSANIVHLIGSGEVAGITVHGPVGDWATSMVPSPNGSSVAVVWQPAPGSPGAESRAKIDAASIVSIINVANGTSTVLPGGSGAVGPIAWTTGGTRVFFAQSTGTGASIGISTYLLGGSHTQKLQIPSVHLPDDFGQSTGSLFIWNR